MTDVKQQAEYLVQETEKLVSYMDALKVLLEKAEDNACSERQRAKSLVGKAIDTNTTSDVISSIVASAVNLDNVLRALDVLGEGIKGAQDTLRFANRDANHFAVNYAPGNLTA